MRARGMKVGSTSGYPRVVMEAVIEGAAAQGLNADCVIAAEETPLGRPSPFQALKALGELGVYPVEAAVKIGDTVVDIEEGLNGGMWSVGLALSGNEIGLSLAEWQALPAGERSALRAQAVAKLAGAGAHYVIDTIADIVPVLDDIDRRLARGEKP
jgi:phosphonoacetaldehyde hydrolase